MKLRRKLLAITMMAILAFVGVGFASWTFQNNEVTQEVSATTKIMCAVELEHNSFKLYNADDDSQVSDIYLICDAPSHTDNPNVVGGEGVYWATDAAGQHKIDTVYIKGALNYDANDIDDLATVTIAFTTGANYLLNNGTYVTFGAATLPANVVIGDDESLVDGAVVTSANFALPVPAYTSAVNSFDDITDVDAITTNLSGLKIVYNAQIINQTLESGYPAA